MLRLNLEYILNLWKFLLFFYTQINVVSRQFVLCCAGIQFGRHRSVKTLKGIIKLSILLYFKQNCGSAQDTFGHPFIPFAKMHVHS